MFRKIVLLFMLLLFSISCFVKLDKADSKGEVVINLKNENTISNSPIAKGIMGEYIEVILTNNYDGREYSGTTTRTQDQQEMYFDNIPYGVYTVTIRLTRPEETKPYSIISNKLVVGSGDASTFSGEIGAPNQISDEGRIGMIYYFDDYSALGLNDEYLYMVFQFNPVGSNLTNPTIDEEPLDYVGYYLYIGTSPVLGSSDLRYPNAEDGDLYATIGERTYYDRLSTNSAFNFMLKDGFAYGVVPKSEFSDFVAGQQYYWKVVAENRDGTTTRQVESTVLPVVMLSSSYKVYEEKIYSPYENEELEYANIESNLSFMFLPFSSIHTDTTPYEYRIVLSYDSSFSSEFEFTATNWQRITSADSPLESPYLDLTPAGGFDGFLPDSTIYWKVRVYAVGGNTYLKESNIKTFIVNPLP